MTIIGPMFKLDILRYLLHKLSLNAGIVNYGRIQIFAMMISKRYQVFYKWHLTLNNYINIF